MSRDHEVVLASMNVHGGRGADGTPFDVTAACRSLGADIIALQEAWHADGQPDSVAETAHGLGAQLIRADLVTDTNLNDLRIASETIPGRFGLALLTTLPVAGCEVAGLGRAPGDTAPRVAQLVTVAMPGEGRLRVANTHLTHRFTSPAQLLRLVRLLAGSNVPTVIVGDLNMPGPLTGLAVGYRQLVRGRTFPAHRPFVQLDHVLASREVAGIRGEVLPAAGSDHLAIRTRLRCGTPGPDPRGGARGREPAGPGEAPPRPGEVSCAIGSETLASCCSLRVL